MTGPLGKLLDQVERMPIWLLGLASFGVAVLLVGAAAVVEALSR